MKKTLTITLGLLLIAFTAYATLLTYGGFAVNGKKDSVLTDTSVTINMSGDIEWKAYVPSATTTCVYRSMSTATKAGIAKPIPGAAWHGRIVNGATPYTNFSGCANGYVERM